MKELIEILEWHYQKYPLMKPQDFIKLVYQNEFGGGHLIKDSISSLNRIKDEVQHSLANQDFDFTPIGNGIVRVNLFDYKNSLEELNDIFIKSSQCIHGRIDNFIQKLEALNKWISHKELSFSFEEWQEYFSFYRKANYPLVSHSEVYRNAYHPAYRVVLFKQFNG